MEDHIICQFNNNQNDNDEDDDDGNIKRYPSDVHNIYNLYIQQRNLL